MANPGFPRRVRQPQRRERQPIILPIFPENCIQLKNIGQGGGASLAPPRIRQWFLFCEVSLRYYEWKIVFLWIVDTDVIEIQWRIQDFLGMQCQCNEGSPELIWIFSKITLIVSRKAQYKDVYRRTIEIPQRAHIFTANSCLKVHNTHLKLASLISR